MLEEFFGNIMLFYAWRKSTVGVVLNVDKTCKCKIANLKELLRRTKVLGYRSRNVSFQF